MRPIIIMAALATALSACGGTADPKANNAANKPANAVANAANTAAAPAVEPGKMFVKWMADGNMSRSKDITIKQGLVRMSTEAPAAAKKNKLVVYDLILANYTFDPANLPGAMPKQYGDTLIVVQLIGDKDASPDGPPKAAAYPAGSAADGDNKSGKVWNILIKYSDDGVKDGKIMADSPKGTRQGQLKITSVDGGKLTGEIDVYDEAGKVKGSFTADLPK